MDLITLIKTILLGIIQGITEWLPISSTGHLLLFDSIWPLETSDGFMDMFKVVIQFGSILAVVVLYFHKLNPFSPKKNPAEKKDTWMIWFKVAVASVPSAIIGFLIEDLIDSKLSANYVIAITLFVYGIGFLIMESKKRKILFENVNDITFKTALLMGVFQTLALIPGTSRSGATILGAIIIGCSRSAAAEFSFFMAVPVMFGASALKLLKSGLEFQTYEWQILITGMLVAFIVSVLAIKLLVGYIKKHDFKMFGWYRIVLAVVIMAYFYLPSLIK